MIKIVSFLLVLIISYDSFPFIIKYLQIRKHRSQTKAFIISNVHASKGRAGIVPVLNYEINGRLYEGIIPLYSSFTSDYGDKILVGFELVVFYNPIKPEECVPKKDLNVLLQIIFLFSIYTLFIFTLLDKISL